WDTSSLRLCVFALKPVHENAKSQRRQTAKNQTKLDDPRRTTERATAASRPAREKEQSQGAGPKRKRQFGAAPLFGNRRFIDSKISGQNAPARRDSRQTTALGNVTAHHSKYTKRNPRPSRSKW